MRTLLTKREVAELLGRSPRTVERMGLKTERGELDKALYHLSDLPPDAQRRWAEREREKVVEICPPTAPPTPGQMALTLAVPAGPNLSPEDRAEAERRFRVIEPLLKPEQYRGVWLQCGNRKTAVVAYLAEHHSTKPRTVYHYLKKFRDGGLPALVTKERSDKGRPRSFNSAALDFIVAAALPKHGAYGKLTVRDIYRAYNEERAWRQAHQGKPLGDFELSKYARYVDQHGCLAPDALLPSASYETFRAWFLRIPDVVKVMAREGDEAFANTQEILSFRKISEIQPLDYLVMDHRRLDLFCMAKGALGEGWKLVRPWLTAAVDMRTRKWLGWVIVETPSSDSIASVLKQVFVRHGLPKAVYWDNGKDFRCEWLEGGRRRNGEPYRVEQLDKVTHGVLDTLGIRVHHAIVMRARSKIIEPLFISTANFDRTLPWWCGHRPTARPESLEKLIRQHDRWLKGTEAATPFRTIEEIAALYNEFIESADEREIRGEGMSKVTPTGRGWMCPNEAWDLLIRRVEVRKAPEDVLAFCFHKRRRLTVRSGELRATFGGRQFHYRMENPVALMALNGREVELGYDPFDLENGALYCDGRFVGMVHNAELRRMGEDSFVSDERKRRAARREVKRFIRAVHGAVYVPDAMERAARREAVRPVRAIAAPAAETEAEVPTEIVNAAETAARDKAFSFDGVEEVPVDPAAYREDRGDDEFQFFQEAK